MDRVADGKIMIPGLSPDADNFFFVFFQLFAKKAKHFILRNHFISCRYNRHFTDDLSPPHFWQTSSN